MVMEEMEERYTMSIMKHKMEMEPRQDSLFHKMVNLTNRTLKPTCFNNSIPTIRCHIYIHFSIHTCMHTKPRTRTNTCHKTKLTMQTNHCISHLLLRGTYPVNKEDHAMTMLDPW